MATIKFFLQSDKNPSGIYVRLREGRDIDAKAKTKYAIDPKQWNSSKGQLKNLKDEDFKILDEDLWIFKTKLLSHYNRSVDTIKIDSLWLKEFINPSIKKDAIPNKLVAYFDYYMLHKKSTVKPATLTKLGVVKHLLERFQLETKSEYLISDVNADFKLRFEHYCSKELYSQNTTARTIRFIKTICYHARNNGIQTHFQLNSIVSKNEKINSVYLTEEEIDKINCVSLKKDHLDNARDWLVISCETGQRVSDFLNFTKDQIRYETTVIKGKETKVALIEFTQVKTQKIMAVPLSKTVIEILDKRGGEFPSKVSEQQYNKYIKQVCQIVGLTQNISGGKVNPKTNRKQVGVFPKFELVASHIGRRSFATNNFGKIPTPLLIHATGHSTEKMFLEYIGKTETETAKLLAEYFV